MLRSLTCMALQTLFPQAQSYPRTRPLGPLIDLCVKTQLTQVPFSDTIPISQAVPSVKAHASNHRVHCKCSQICLACL